MVYMFLKKGYNMYLMFDGGNGGPNVNKGYGSFVIRDNKQGPNLHHVKLDFDGFMTSNEAEYNTLYCALLYIQQQYSYVEYLFIEGDSELVRRQVGNIANGVWIGWRAKEQRLLVWRDKVRSVIKNYNYSYTHVPRKEVVAQLGH